MGRWIWVLPGICLITGCNNFSGNYLRPTHGIVIPDSATGRLPGFPTIMPAGAPSISQGYMPAPALRYKRDSLAIHNGIDIVARRGTPVYAVADGTVRISMFEPLYGHRVEVEHPADADGNRYRTRYFHLRKRLVSAGMTVTMDQPIGELGSSGLLAAFPHLHLEVAMLPAGTRDWQPVNPHGFWADGPGRVTCWQRSQTATANTFRIHYPLDCRAGEIRTESQREDAADRALTGG